MKKNIIGSLIFSRSIVIVLTITGIFCSPLKILVSGQEQQSRGWKVWIRTDPCSGRFDWLSVAKEQQGGGKNTYVPYETELGDQGCTRSGDDGCTFKEATDLMEALRGDDKFFDHCCHDYSVWENVQTDEKSVFLLRSGTPGTGWQLVKDNLCCEEAEDLAGKPGVCSGKRIGGGGTTSGGFSGNWTLITNLGNLKVTMIQADNHVSGTFVGPYGNGKLDGTLNGKVLRFQWQSGEDRGLGEATLSEDGESFSGYLSFTGLDTRTAFNATKDPE